VAEKFLDGSDVRAVDEELGRVGVAEGVGGYFFNYSCFAGVLTDDVFDGDGGKGLGEISYDVLWTVGLF